ncbi:MAG: hypothetical protein ACHP8A_10655 [Terriglobales bacterium]|jgi:hypothetical protein
MRSILSAIIFVASFSSAAVAQNTPEPAVQVELNPQKPLHLRVTLRSGAATTATFYRSELPWGNRYSMVFAAVRPNGHHVDLELPVDDPGPTKVSVKPREVLTGDIDLRYVIRDQNATKTSDVLLFWAYKPPDELHIPRWSGGLVVIPQQK